MIKHITRQWHDNLPCECTWPRNNRKYRLKRPASSLFPSIPVTYYGHVMWQNGNIILPKQVITWTSFINMVYLRVMKATVIKSNNYHLHIITRHWTNLKGGRRWISNHDPLFNMDLINYPCHKAACALLNCVSRDIITRKWREFAVG